MSSLIFGATEARDVLDEVLYLPSFLCQRVSIFHVLLTRLKGEKIGWLFMDRYLPLSITYHEAANPISESSRWNILQLMSSVGYHSILHLFALRWQVYKVFGGKYRISPIKNCNTNMNCNNESRRVEEYSGDPIQRGIYQQYAIIYYSFANCENDTLTLQTRYRQMQVVKWWVGGGYMLWAILLPCLSYFISHHLVCCSIWNANIQDTTKQTLYTNHMYGVVLRCAYHHIDWGDTSLGLHAINLWLGEWNGWSIIWRSWSQGGPLVIVL